MINRKIVFSILSILSALTLLGSSAFAAFVVQVSASGSTFSVVDEILQIADTSGSGGAPGTFGASIAGFKGEDLQPGPTDFWFYLKNPGKVTLPLSTQFTNVTGTGVGIGTGYLENDMEVIIGCVDATNDTVPIGPSGGFEKSFKEWETQTELTGISLAPNQVAKCYVMPIINTSGGNAIVDHGQTLNFNAVFGS